MSSTREHRAKAEQLLEEAHTTQDQISRSLILAEAQVHATLALSAPPGASPPNRGRTQTGGTAGTPGTASGLARGQLGLRPAAPRVSRGDGPRPQVPRRARSPPPGRGTPRQRADSPAARARQPVRPGAFSAHAGHAPRPGSDLRNNHRKRNPARKGSHPLRVTSANRTPGAPRPSGDVTCPLAGIPCASLVPDRFTRSACAVSLH